ncbi:hypothetical protein B0H17DRAFT_1130438 [Mycena rosella]|uniref:Uncharacterized protein n=1 Tax=Mycena rosella TaxID=1033263 RepID=A0AAD7DRJ8_MYCRO|nr:hypothetical protein B0H17DRAFT_1130438 [Mycena rosella]
MDTELEEEGYEEAFINDGDPYDEDDNVSAVTSTMQVLSLFDLEAMDEDDSMFRKPPGVKARSASPCVPSGYPPHTVLAHFLKPPGVKASSATKRSVTASYDDSPDTTRVATKHGAASVSEASDPVESARPVTKRRVAAASDRVEPVASNKKPKVRRAPTGPTFEGAMSLWMDKFMAERAVTIASTAPAFDPVDTPIFRARTPRADFDRIELDKGIQASLESPVALTTPTCKSKGKGKAKVSSVRSSPDWDPPLAGEAFIPVVAMSSPSKALAVGTPNASEPKHPDVAISVPATVSSEKPTHKVVSSCSAAAGSAVFKADAKDGDVSQFMKKTPRPIASAGGSTVTKALTMAQFLRVARGEPEPEGEEGDDKEPSPETVIDGASTVFLEDLETYKAHFDVAAPCGVFDLDLQDESLRPSYVGLHPLPALRRIIPAFDCNRIFGDDSINYTTGGRVCFSSWYNQLPKMLAGNSMGALLFKESDPNFINLSRVSPVRLSSSVSAGSSTTMRLQVNGRIAVCLTSICVTELHVVTARNIGAKSERRRKWISGVPHDYDWECLESIVCLTFRKRTMYGQMSDKAISFQTMISPENAKTSDATTDRFNRSVPSSMFSTRSPGKPAASTSGYCFKTLLAFDDLVPVYDARKTVINFDADLDRLEKVLPAFVGEVPSGSFAIVAYSCSSYSGSISSSNQKVPYVGLNVLWVVVCGVPSA